jgi:hypothetical protein
MMTRIVAFACIAIAGCLAASPDEPIGDSSAALVDTEDSPSDHYHSTRDGSPWAGRHHGNAPVTNLPASGNGIDYHGGPVMRGPLNVYYIWYGNWTGNTATTILTDLAKNIGGSPYFGINTTYSDTVGPVANVITLASSTTDNYSQGTALTDNKVRSVVTSAISSGRLPKDANAVYFVLASQDVSETSGFCTKYCGWHTYAMMAGTDVKYSFIGNPARCPTACAAQSTTSPNGNVGADGMASILIHELEEAATDPDLNAWYDATGAENADKCAWTFGTTYAVANGSNANVRLGSRDFLIQQNWVNAAGGYCAMSYATCATDADCGDGNVCTDDTCTAGTCLHVSNTASCNDGNACTTGDLCASSTCAGLGLSCDDSNTCTNDSCNPSTGCVNVATDCTGGNVCLSGSCTQAQGCVTTPVANGTTCPGGSCQSGACVASETCSTFTGTGSTTVRQTFFAIGNKLTGKILTGTLSCAVSADLDLYLQVQSTAGVWTLVGQSTTTGTCTEATTYTVPAIYNGLAFRWGAGWRSGASSYTLKSCEK